MAFGIVTFCDNNNYAKGALVLARSLRHVGTQCDLVCLITNHISTEMKSQEWTEIVIGHAVYFPVICFCVDISCAYYLTSAS